ncbi:MAG: ATP-binding protein [Candidatus Methanomethylophilaceae archaeon]|nr:ATP-binding protein [Candidatus Methanomethylophilaceae archaeon]
MNNDAKDKTILQLMDILSEESDDSRLGGDFWEENRPYAEELAHRLSTAAAQTITPTQAVLFSICLRRGPKNVDFDDIARHLDISNIQALMYSGDLSALVRARYLKFHDAAEEDSFDMPASVVRALKANKVPESPQHTGLKAAELFGFVDEMARDLYNGAILPGDFYNGMTELFACNKELGFVRELNALGIRSNSDWMVLVLLCHLLVNKNDDKIVSNQIKYVYQYRSDFTEAWSSFQSGRHWLMQRGLVEHVCEDGMADTSMIHLSSWAKSHLLADFNLSGSEVSGTDLVGPETITGKQLFYTAKNASQVDELCAFLMPEQYDEICKRMKENGYRSGFTCLFHGPPGTGKTETVYQLALRTGRSIMAVNVTKIKSKWVGESEKNIKEVFDRYRGAVKSMKLAPILLFNEADSIFGIRHEGAQQATDKMENSIQNIILQEMETIEGILIATTNLTQNLDPAFERRFLYKIRFERPDASVREKIWHVMLPALDPEDCAELASAYDLSGGQMENVARRFIHHVVLYGREKVPLAILRTYCSEERMDSRSARRIGF